MKEFFEKLLGSQPVTIILVFGAIFIALGALGGIPLNDKITGFDEFGRYVLIAVGALFLVFALILVFRSTTLINFRNHRITLSYPKGSDDGKFIPVTEEYPEFGGEHKNRNLGNYQFRIVILSNSRNKYWHQDLSRLNWSENGKWNAAVWFQNVNDEKIILAVLVPSSGASLFDYYVQNARKTNWAAIQGSLPKDIIEVGEVKLKRVA